jgi:hypothetical protein
MNRAASIPPNPLLFECCVAGKFENSNHEENELHQDLYYKKIYGRNLRFP